MSIDLWVNDKVVLLCSGGIDSGVLLAHLAKTGNLAGIVFFNYGQPALAHEISAVYRQMDHHQLLDVPVLVREVQMLALPMQRPAGEPGPRVVPHRNLILLGLALNWAEYLGAREVWYGAIRDDHEDYRDCRPEFVLGLNQANLAASFTYAIRAGQPLDSVKRPPLVVAPLSGSRKPAIVEEARKLGILELCWSCYAPIDGAPCGGCNSCLARIKAGG